MAEALKYGVALAAGISHPEYSVTVDPVGAAFRNALVQDLK
jgi:hypothetical protein